MLATLRFCAAAGPGAERGTIGSTINTSKKPRYKREAPMSRFFAIALGLVLACNPTSPSVPPPVASQPLHALSSVAAAPSAEAPPAPSGEVPAAWPYKLETPPVEAPHTMVTTDA